MKIFIAQTADGFQNRSLLAIRERIKKKCNEAFPNSIIEFVDLGDLPSIIFPEGMSITAKRVTYLARSIGMMADADLIVFVGDPEATPSTSVELKIAQRYEMKYIYAAQLDEIIKHEKIKRKKREEDKNESSNSG